MELMDLLKAGASMIESNNDDATTGLDIDDITNALNGMVGNGEGGLDLGDVCQVDCLKTVWVRS